MAETQMLGTVRELGIKKSLCGEVPSLLSLLVVFLFGWLVNLFIWHHILKDIQEQITA